MLVVIFFFVSVSADFPLEAGALATVEDDVFAEVDGEVFEATVESMPFAFSETFAFSEPLLAFSVTFVLSALALVSDFVVDFTEVLLSALAEVLLGDFAEDLVDAFELDFSNSFTIGGLSRLIGSIRLYTKEQVSCLSQSRVSRSWVMLGRLEVVSAMRWDS